MMPYIDCKVHSINCISGRSRSSLYHQLYRVNVANKLS